MTALESWRVGGITVRKLVEVEYRAPLSEGTASALAGATVADIEAIDWLSPTWIDDDRTVGGGVHSFLLETPAGGRFIVDTGIGNDKSRAAAMFDGLDTDFLQRLRVDAGWEPDDVTGVICTHLHIDHTGWNTRLVEGSWVPTFPNATYYFVRSEFEHWRAFAADPDSDDVYLSDWARDMVDGTAVFLDSVQPVYDAGLVTLVDADQTIAPGIRLEPSFGHTPGHVCVVIESEGETAVITGDSMHTVFQVAHPEWSSFLDTDLDGSRESRIRFVEKWADSGALILGTHWGPPTGGRIVRASSGFRLD